MDGSENGFNAEEFLSDLGRYIGELGKASQDISGELATVEKDFGAAAKRVEDHFDLLSKELTKRRALLLTQLSELKADRIRSLQEQQTALNETHVRLSADMLRIRHAVDDGHQEDTEHFVAKLLDLPELGEPVVIPPSIPPRLTLDREYDLNAIQNLGFLDYKPRITGMPFVYKEDFDLNGILYWIGCGYGTSAYTNPADLNLVAVSASSCEFGEPRYAIGHPSAALPHHTFMSRSEQGSWLQVHLGVQYVVCPTAYTLRNCPVNPCHSLRNWEFQGSEDGEHWTVLVKHEDDFSLTPSKGSVCTWPIKGCSSYFNRFRVIMTGPNQYVQPHAKFFYLMLAGFEIYGFVEKRQ